MAQGTTANYIGARDPHVRVHPGEGTVFEQDVFAEVRSNHAPSCAVSDVVHAAVDHAEIYHVVCVIVVRAHVDRFSRRSNGRVDLVPGSEAVAQRDIGALANTDETGVGMPHRRFTHDIVGQPVDLCIRA